MQDYLIRAFVEDVLRNPGRHTWTLQGLGMLRTYIGGGRDLRLHVWDDRYAVEGVSEVHDHPWDLTSYVVSGAVLQYRYKKSRSGEWWSEQTLHCGEGGGLCGVPVPVTLERCLLEKYLAGDTYQQTHDEIHRSIPRRGTVTLVRRGVPEGGDPDKAHVYFQGEWVSAEPRPAETLEALRIIGTALEGW